MSLLQRFQKFHLIGIGGISMSAIAKYLLAVGKTVSGSDRVYGVALSQLTDKGADCWGGTLPDRIPADAAVIYTSAIAKDNAELLEVVRRGQTAVERQVFLAEWEKLYPTRVAVAGTHGKTTVSAMLASVFSAAKLKFTAHIGGYPIGSDNFIYAGEDIFLSEACEYNRNFLSLSPTHVVVNNVEMDHPDTYKSIYSLYAAFDELLNKDSVVKRFVNGTCTYRHTLNYTDYQMHTFSGEHSHVYAESVMRDNDGTCGFRVRIVGGEEFRLKLKVPGLVNVDNALATVAVARELGVPTDKIIKGLSDFAGVQRRFERRGSLNGAPIFVDYAHHPTEIRAAVDTAVGMSAKRLIVVFQPHTYSRTAALYEGFLTAFRGADRLFITGSYSAREHESAGLTAYDLYRGIVREEMFCCYYQTLLPLAKALSAEVGSGDLLLILGAGDVDMLASILAD